MRDESLCGCSCHAVTRGQYIRLCLPVFLINSKWNCKQMKQFYTKCILSESLLCYCEEPGYHRHIHYCPVHSQAKVHKSWFGCLLGYCYRSKPILKVFYMLLFYLTINLMLLHIRLFEDAAACYFSADPHMLQVKTHATHKQSRMSRTNPDSACHSQVFRVIQ